MSLDFVAMGKYVDDSSSSSSSSDSDSDDGSSNDSSSSSSSSSSSAASSPASSPRMLSSRKKALTTATGKVRGKPGPKPKAQRAVKSAARLDEELSPPPPPPMMPPPPPPPPLAAVEKPKKKRASPVKRKPATAPAKVKKQKVQPTSRAPPPPPPPPSPPPPPPSDDSSNSSSSVESSSSSSSSDSDDFEEETVRPPPTSKQSRASPASGRSKAAAAALAGMHSPPLGPDALKVKLKLPPGFVAKHPDGAALKTTLAERGKLKVQVTNSRPPAKKQKTSTPNGAAKKKSATTPKAKTPKKSAATTPKKGKNAQPAPPPPPPMMGNGLAGQPPPPPVQPILPKLIPIGPTVPTGEVRGKRELTLIGDLEAAATRPEEIPESDLPSEFNDPFAVESDALRNLDLFFFCDEHGNAIGLDILEKPKHERPKIMGFGTIVQHLPPAERPLPVKYILPSPAFPSRSRKRPRSDSAATASPPAKPSKARSSTKGAGSKKKSANGTASGEQIPQLDGSMDASMHSTSLASASPPRNIFASAAVYEYSARNISRKVISQLDGYSSEGSSDGSRSGEESVGSGSDSDGCGSDEETRSGFAGSGTDSGSESDGQSTTSASHHEQDMQPTAESSPSHTSDNGASTPLKHAPKKVSKSVSPSKPSTLNPVVDELMRTDREGVVEQKGTDDELNLMECGFRHPEEYKRARVWLPEITDWCLDYAEGDPTLWIITPHAWYKIAGPLAGMLPHASYRKKFQHVRKLFEASYLVAYVLKEWLPINKKVSYRSTLQQIVELSLRGRYPVSGWFLMENCQFIQNQISDLVADKEAYLDSMFFKQLQRMYEAHRAREQRVKKDLAEREEKRARREDERQKKKQQLEEERKKLLDKKEEERKQKEAERRYPIDDIELLAEEGSEISPRFPVDVSEWCGLDGLLLGDVIVAWQTICTFKDFVSLQPISLDDLTASIASQDQGETSISLIRVFMAFLRVILSEKSFVSPTDDLVVEGSTTVADLFVNTERTYGICERPYLELLNAITWQDILRQLMAKDLNIDASIGSIEPLVGCEIVRQTLYMQNNSVPFNAPVDVKIKGLEDYAQIVKHPMDLGTIKQKMDAGQYEIADGHEVFAADIRLIWDNAVLFNGEESDIGKAALGLSDIFEQDYQRLVLGRIVANKSMIKESSEIASALHEKSTVAEARPSFVDIAHALYAVEFYQLPVPFKIGALSWLCSEFLKLDGVRSHIESQAEREFEANREYRRKAGEIEVRRKQAEKNRREREAAFRKECIDQGIEPNANNHFSDAVKQEHAFIADFYEELHAEKLAEEVEWQEDRKTLDEETRTALDGVIVRESPLGRDRYHNSYWVFKNDTKRRLFIERSDSGDFIAITREEDVDALLAWLNPKGIRELDLLGKLNKLREELVNDLTTSSGAAPSSFWGSENVLTVSLFPLPGEETKSKDLLELSAARHTRNGEVIKQMLLRMHEYLQLSNITPTGWDATVSWTARVQRAESSVAFHGLFGELEAAIIGSRGGEDTIRSSWKRKRREWRLSLEGSQTVSQLVFLLQLFLAECINVEAFMDLSARLDRKDFLKLRPKECRNFIPEIDKKVVYFGDGHQQALKEDAKGKKKRFARKSDAPLLRKTLLCHVVDASYYLGGGDPYALLVLRPETELKDQVTTRRPGELLCAQPSPLQRLARIFQRIVAKLKLHSDSGPFLDPVSDRDFPEYKEIIPHPMDFSKITTKARACQYKKADQFLADFKLMASNCEVFCEDRFPSLPPLARNVSEMAEVLVKKSLKELRVCEKAVAEGADDVKEDVLSGDAVVKSEVKSEENGNGIGSADHAKSELVVILRLENRLPEYVVDLKRYESAVSRTWHCGEKFKMLFRDPKGYPGQYYGGVAAGSLPFDANGLLPWEALRVVWDEDDGSDDSRINPWEAEVVPEGRKGK